MDKRLKESSTATSYNLTTFDIIDGVYLGIYLFTVLAMIVSRQILFDRFSITMIVLFMFVFVRKDNHYDYIILFIVKLVNELALN
jgi:hypothetical protein